MLPPHRAIYDVEQRRLEAHEKQRNRGMPDKANYCGRPLPIHGEQNPPRRDEISDLEQCGFSVRNGLSLFDASYLDALYGRASVSPAQSCGPTATVLPRWIPRAEPI